MTLRRAAAAEIPRLVELAQAATDTPLLAPFRLSVADAAWLADHSDLWVWDADGAIGGFAASDPRDGRIRALVVAPGQDGRGIGRTLLEAACRTLRARGLDSATLSVAAGSRAEGFYRAAGWQQTARDAGSVEFRLALGAGGTADRDRPATAPAGGPGGR
ncbi:hypothetical protein STVA_14520 [Allostella vacuolata]|nr:hypothetical protein STVA_14520 [Stella vacuolata]